jgi:CPA2 family monovalent cation:H+ antiporter-2
LAIESVFLLDLGILAGSALVFSLLFARLKISIIPGQILAGMIVGPYVLGWVTDPVVLNDISQIGIVLLLFIIGLELDPVQLRKLLGEVTSMTLLEVGVAFSFAMLAAYPLRLTLLDALIFSMAGSITSTAIVGRVFLARRMLRTVESGFLIGLLVIEDMAAVVFLIILSSITSARISSFPYFAIGASSLPRGLFSAIEAVLGGFALIGAGYVVARYVAPRVINYLSHYEEEFEEIPFLFALGLGFLFAVLAQFLGYSAGIGAFIIGLSIRGKHSKFLERQVTPVKDLFLVLFFVSIGSLIDPVPAIGFGLALVLAMVLLLLGKFAGGYAMGRIFVSRHKSAEKKRPAPAKNLGDGILPTAIPPAQTFGAWLTPRGEFSLLIAQLALSLGLVGESFFSIVGLSVVVTAIVGAVLQKVTEPKIAPSKFPFKGEADEP